MCFITSLVVFIILLHFDWVGHGGSMYYASEDYVYRNNLLRIYMHTGIIDTPTNYVEKIKVYKKVLFSYHSILPILIGTGVSLIITFLFKFVKIKVE